MPFSAELSPGPAPQRSGRDFALSVFAAREPARWDVPPAPTLRFVSVEGKSMEVTEGDTVVPLGPNDGLVVPPGRPVVLRCPPSAAPQSATAVVLTLRRPPVQELLRRTGVRAGSYAPHPDASVVLAPLPPALVSVRRVLVALSRRPDAHRDALVDLSAAQVVLCLLSTAARGAVCAAAGQPVLSPSLAAAVRYVHRHLDRPIAVDDLATVACMSRSTFYRRFRDAVGTTPLQYVTQQRIERARRLLRDPERSVTSVSYDLGFRNVSHFITVFREHVGRTPQAYQRAQRDA